MIRLELIRRISEKFGIEETEAGVFVDGIFESMVRVFKKGKKINIPEFGKFNITNQIVDGLRHKYVVFSPSKNFADTINKNFSDLKPLVVRAYNVKSNEILKVKEILPVDNEDEYLYFEFDSSEEDTVKEECPDAVLIREDSFSQKEAIVEEEISNEEIPVEEIPGTDKISQIKSYFDSDTEQNIFTESNSFFTDEISGDIKQEQNIFDEEIDENVINQQNVFADSPADIDLSERILLSEFSINSEEQILENEKIIEEVQNISPLSVRVILKDDMNIDNIKEEIFDILVKREEIIRELNALNIGFKKTPDEFNILDDSITETPKVEEVFKSEDKLESKDESEYEEFPIVEDDSTDLFTELEKRIKELDELSQKQEELKKIDLDAPMSQEMQIFGKLIDDTHFVNKEIEKPSEVPEIIIHEPEAEAEYIAPKSLSDALQDIKLDGVIEHLDITRDEDGIKSYDDIFRKSENQFVPQYSVESEDKNPQGRFFKIFLYIFFIFLLTAFSFYIYKTMFTKSTGNQVIDTIGLTKIDSIRQLLININDSIANKDTSKLNMEDETEQTESIEIKNINGVVYRELEYKIYIQNKVLDDLNEAEEMEMKLKSNNLNCIVEGGTKIDSGLEYRVLIGPFKSIEEAMEYYEKHKVVLNFIQIINTNKPYLLVL